MDPSTNEKKLEISKAKSCCWQERAKNSVLHTESSVSIASLEPSTNLRRISKAEICQQERARDSALSLHKDPIVGYIDASKAGFSAVSAFFSALIDPLFMHPSQASLQASQPAKLPSAQ